VFFYGKTDWMVGPNPYKGVNFPNMLLWASDVGHIAPLENPADLAKVIETYRHKYGL
jgi:proline iminopeptidase